MRKTFCRGCSRTMGKVEVFAVTFEGNRRTFYPGELISGTVLLKVNKELKLRGVRIEFHGQANVRWSESSGSGENRRTRSHNNQEEYINTLATLYGKAPGADGDNPVLAPGEYNFPFSFQIPQKNLPTSFEGKHGHIRYWLKAVIDRPWRFDITTKVAFTMIEYVDINRPELLCPLHLQEDRQIGCLCCVSGTLSITGQTDRGGYCPGEIIGISIYVGNRSRSNIVGFRFSIYQIIDFVASTGKRKTCSEKVTMVENEGGRRGEDIHLQMIPLSVPSLPPSMTSCSCIKIHYEVQVTVRVSGAFNSTLKLPVTIGSVPYCPSPPQYSQGYPPQTSAFPSAPALNVNYGSIATPPSMHPPSYGGGPVQSYPGDAPPSYAECVYGGASIRDEGDSTEMMGETTFTPMYPFVNNYQYPPPTAPSLPQGAHGTT